jgi:hypothetical protein
MYLQDQMFAEIEQWVSSRLKKSDFLKDKPFSEGKFNYWLKRWRDVQLQKDVQEGVFREIDTGKFSSLVSLGKVLEIEAPSGVKITVFA